MAVDLTLRLVRHGATDWTDQRRYTGFADVPLNRAGRERLETLELPAGAYASITSSDLSRCRDTASALGFDPRPDPTLREFDFGTLEGLTWDDLDPQTRAGLLAYDDFVAPGGESVAAFARRIDGFVDALGPGLHLLFTHGGVIHHLLRQAGVERHIAPGEWVDVVVSRR